MRRLDVEIDGEGPDLILLHSLLTDRTSFAQLRRRLASQRRLIVPNVPGFGASAPGKALEEYAERVLDLFDEHRLPRTTDVLGNGLGSFVALKAAARDGRLRGRLVLLGAAVAFPEPARQTFRALAEKVEREGMESAAEAAMARMFPSDFIAAHPAVIADRRSVFVGMDRAVFADAARALAELDLAPVLDRIRNEVLVVVGEKDEATPPALGQELSRRLPNARMIELPGVGHAPHIQAPDQLIDAIGPFLGLRR
jgi:3-oxoadipate enol-lactonase